MRDKSWVLEPLRENDARQFLDVILFKVLAGNSQAIEYKEDIIYVISKEQYQKLLSLDKDNS